MAGASAMQQTLQTCQNLWMMTQTQMLDEDKIDPFPMRSTVELEELVISCRRTREILTRESLIYSRDADFSRYTDMELAAMNAFVRENYRILSIVLAGGKQHFFHGQGLSTVQELRNMYGYIDDKVKDFLQLDKIIDTLEIKTGYKCKNGSKIMSKTAALHNHAAEMTSASITAIDANKASSSQESLERIASVCDKFASQCRAIAEVRVAKMKDRSRKLEVRDTLLKEIEMVLPLVRQHVLRIGLSRSQIKAAEVAQPGGKSNVKTKDDMRCHSTKLTTLFTYSAVEDAHHAVEDCRERLLGEVLFRSHKAERRLEREEATERKGGGKSGANLQDVSAYKDVLDETRKKEARSRSPSPERSGRSRKTENSPERKEQSPPPRSSERLDKSPSNSPSKSPSKDKSSKSAMSKTEKGYPGTGTTKNRGDSPPRSSKQSPSPGGRSPKALGRSAR